MQEWQLDRLAVLTPGKIRGCSLCAFLTAEFKWRLHTAEVLNGRGCRCPSGLVRATGNLLIFFSPMASCCGQGNLGTRPSSPVSSSLWWYWLMPMESPRSCELEHRQWWLSCRSGAQRHLSSQPWSWDLVDEIPMQNPTTVFLALLRHNLRCKSPLSLNSLSLTPRLLCPLPCYESYCRAV